MPAGMIESGCAYSMLEAARFRASVKPSGLETTASGAVSFALPQANRSAAANGSNLSVRRRRLDDAFIARSLRAGRCPEPWALFSARRIGLLRPGVRCGISGLSRRGRGRAAWCIGKEESHELGLRRHAELRHPGVNAARNARYG